MNIFYINVSKKVVQKLIEERDYYIANGFHDNLPGVESREGFKLMAELYNALISAAQKHIAEHSE